MKSLIIRIALVFPLLINAQPSTLSNGLQACYPLDCDNAVNQSLIGNSLDGQAMNVTCASDRHGNPNSAYQFAGNATSKIQLPGMPPLKGQFMCISGWYYISNLSVQTLIFTRNSSPLPNSNFDGYAIGLLNINGGWRFISHKQFPQPNPNAPVTNGMLSSFVQANQWYHIVAYFDHAKVWMYVNNVFQGSSTIQSPIDYHPSKDVIIGGTDEGSDWPFSGKIDDLRFYDRELLATEVDVLYNNNPNCSTPRPVGMTEFDTDENSLTLFPNPSTGKFLLSHPGDVEIKITDITGKALEFNMTTLSDTKSELNIMANPGIYFAQMFDKKGRLLNSKKVIIE